MCFCFCTRSHFITDLWTRICENDRVLYEEISVGAVTSIVQPSKTVITSDFALWADMQRQTWCELDSLRRSEIDISKAAEKTLEKSGALWELLDYFCGDGRSLCGMKVWSCVFLGGPKKLRRWSSRKNLWCMKWLVDTHLTNSQCEKYWLHGQDNLGVRTNRSIKKLGMSAILKLVVRNE